MFFRVLLIVFQVQSIYTKSKTIPITRANESSSSGFADYMRGPCISPWAIVEGWNVKCAFHDPMHTVFLGTCRDLYPSSLGYWIRKNYFGRGSLDDRLLQFSLELKTECRQERRLIFQNRYFFLCGQTAQNGTCINVV